MSDDEKYKDFINIGTEKCAVFVRLSKRLLKVLDKYPFLHYAIEEGVLSAEKYEYYAASILAFSQLLNTLSHPTPKERHLVAHHFLEMRPEEKTYRKISKILKVELEQIADDELSKAADKSLYFEELQLYHKKLYP